MRRLLNCIIALAYLMFGVGVTTAQKRKDYRNDVFVQLEILDMTNGLPGAASKSTCLVGGAFGRDTRKEKDPSGKQIYVGTIDGQSRWVEDNAIEITLNIDENGTKRTETIHLSNFEPKTLVLRENRALVWRELLRLTPVFEPNQPSSQSAAYEQGWFGKTNFPEALKWLRKSAEQGNADAQNSLGQMYEDGESVIQNYSLAAKWFRKAAEHEPDLGGAGQGRNNFGMLYLDGNGVPKDYVQAYVWFRLADFESNANLSLAKSHLTPEQILEAEYLVEQWKRQHIKLQQLHRYYQ